MASNSLEKRRRRKPDVDYCLATECIKLHLVRCAGDLSRETDAFSPEFVEECFGPDGKIYGYKGLKVDIWLHEATFDSFAEVQYDSKLDVIGSEGSVSDIWSVLRDIFGKGLLENRADFLEKLTNYDNDFRNLVDQHGEILMSWEGGKDQSANSPNRQLERETISEVVRFELKNVAVREWHGRFTPLVLMFVEGASAIDAEDPSWVVFVTTERLKEKSSCRRVTGFCNVFRFYCYPDKTRLRISQIFVLPPYQGKGYGFHLLDAINNMASKEGCYEITMEAPSEKLQELRNCVDVLRLLTFSPVMDAVDRTLRVESRNRVEPLAKKAKVSLSATTGKAKLRPPAGLAGIVREEFKICKMQFHKCWEILLILHLDLNDTAARDSFKELLITRLCSELILEEKMKNSCVKKVVDIDNPYDNSKTFVMMRFKKKPMSNGHEPVQRSYEALFDDADNGPAIQELLEAEEREIMDVAQKISGLCRRYNVPVKFMLK